MGTLAIVVGRGDHLPDHRRRLLLPEQTLVSGKKKGVQNFGLQLIESKTNQAFTSVEIERVTVLGVLEKKRRRKLKDGLRNETI